VTLLRLQRYGRCEPRGGGTGDRTIATVVKAPDGDGLAATSAETDETQRGVRLTTRAHSCALLQTALKQELDQTCGSQGESCCLA
jgi:hypothetical protein